MFAGMTGQPFTVNCRIGSLEKNEHGSELADLVNCRIGSLEKGLDANSLNSTVNCRIGSLENGGSL